MFGQGAALLGTALVPGGAEADVLGMLGDAGRVADAAGDLGKAGEVASDAGKAADLTANASKAAKMAGDAGKTEEAGSIAGASGTAGAPEPPVLRLRGTDYEIPGWHSEPISYTKRAPDELAALRREFDGGLRRDFLRDLGANHADTLRAAGMDDAQVARVASGRVPQGYQVHHYLPLDDGGTNAYDNLVYFVTILIICLLPITRTR